MAEEYDVDAEIRVKDESARGATARLAGELRELTQISLHLGSVLTGVLKGIRPEMGALAVSTRTFGRNMGKLVGHGRELGKVTAPLVTRLRQANTQVVQLERSSIRSGDALAKTFSRAGPAALSFGGMLRSAIAFGGAYIGYRVVSNALMSMTRSAFEFQSINDKNRISLSAILAATQPAIASITDQTLRMAEAGKVGSAIFRQLQGDALKSVATSQEMQSMYAMIVGPLAGAGARLSEIRQITNDTVSAASVLGVDFAQASRDIMLMSTGAAGLDTMLFRMLRSTGRIMETTQEWNALLPEKRLSRLKEALSGFAPAAEAFEKTLPGITSSFVDYLQRFRGALLSGPLESLRTALVRFVDIFRSNETRITALLTTMGNAFARWLDPALNAFANATEYFIANWDHIAGRIQTSLERWTMLSSNVGAGVKHYAPTIGTAAKAAGAGLLISRFAPGAVTALQTGISAGLAGGAAGTAGGATGAIASVTHFVSVIAAMGGTFTYILPVIGIVVGLLGVMGDAWSHLVPVFGAVWTLMQDIFGTIWGLISGVAGVLLTLAKIVGGVIGSVIMFGAIISMFVFRYLWQGVIKPVISFFSVIVEAIGKGLDWIYDKVLWVFTSLADLFGTFNAGLLPAGQGGATPGFFDNLMDGFNKAMEGFQKQSISDEYVLGAAEAGAPTARKTTVNDFRGSKIEVKQDFRQADPDRVWLQFVEGINDAAEQRLASALVPDFTR